MDTEQTTLDYMRLTGRWWELDTLPEVAQAVGMVSRQLDCPQQDAAMALRVHIAAHAQDPVHTARDIVNHKLSFAP